MVTIFPIFHYFFQSKSVNIDFFPAWERSTKEPLMEDLCLNTKGIMFYSVPHKGSSLADFTVPFVRKSVELLEIGRGMYIISSSF